jgi:hypothetical protein
MPATGMLAIWLLWWPSAFLPNQSHRYAGYALNRHQDRQVTAA